MKRFLPDKNETSTRILINGNVLVQELQAVNFTRKDLVPVELNMAKLPSIMPEQMIKKKQKLSTFSRAVR